MRNLNAWLAALCCLSLPLCRPDRATEAIAPVYNVSGTVTTAEGEGASGASLVLTEEETGATAAQALAGADGAYIFTGVAAGNYALTATLGGYESATLSGVRVTDADVTDKNLRMEKISVPVYRISGRVTQADGQAAQGASVRIFRSEDAVPAGETVATDADGAYEIGNIPSGLYYIVVTLEGYETGMLAEIAVEDADRPAQNITLQTPTVNAEAIRIRWTDSQATVENLPADGSVDVTLNKADVALVSHAQAKLEIHLSGATTQGSLDIQNLAPAPNTLLLKLDNAEITSASDLPPLKISGKETTCILHLQGVNRLADHAANRENAALIHTGGSLEVEGFGQLWLSGAAKHALASANQSVAIRGGDLQVTAAAADGIHAGNGFMLSGGSVTIAASGDGIDAGTGRAEITGGSLRIAAPSDDVKGMKGDAGIRIAGGLVEISVAGTQSKGIGSKGDILISGGDLSITASGAAALAAQGNGYDPSFAAAIKSDAAITVTGGTLRLDCPASADGGKGLSADGNIRIEAGTLHITTAGPGKVYTSPAGATDSYTAACIKSDRDIILSGGDISCYSSGSGGKGVNAAQGITIGESGAANALLTLRVGTSGERFSLGATQGSRPTGAGPMGNGGDYANPKAIKCEGDLVVHSGTVTILCTQQSAGGEGMESKGALAIHGGAIHIQSYDDCINGGASVAIHGGTLFVAAKAQDAIDSNGTMTFNGGLTVANGVRGDGEAFDGQTGRYVVNAGVLVGTSGSLMEIPAGPQASVIYSRAKAGGDIAIRNTAGEYLLLFRVPVISGATSGTNLIVVFSTPRLTAGNYSLLSGGQIQGGVSFNGYVSGGSYQGGTSQSFAITQSAYTHVQ